MSEQRNQNCPRCKKRGNLSSYVKASNPPIYSASCDNCKIKWEFRPPESQAKPYNPEYKSV